MLPQVGEGAGRALEVGAGDLHALGESGRQAEPIQGVGFTLEPRTLSTPPRFLTSSDTRLSMAPSMECSAPGKAEKWVRAQLRLLPTWVPRVRQGGGGGASGPGAPALHQAVMSPSQASAPQAEAAPAGLMARPA